MTQDGRPSVPIRLGVLGGRCPLPSSKAEEVRARGVRGRGYQNQPPRDSSCWQLRYWAPNSEARDWTFCETFFSHGLAS